MKTLRRFHVPGADYFITGVTFRRRRILLDNLTWFFESWPFVELIAWVVHSEHFHVMLNVGNRSISDIMHAFKISYVHRRRETFGLEKIWQHRFWDHVIRDENDFARHLDYIHFNPVHHDICTDPFEYPFSSIWKWYDLGVYQRDWGCQESPDGEGEFGE